MLACSAKIQQNGAKCKSAKMGAEGPNPKKRKIRTGRRQRGAVVSEQPADDDEKGADTREDVCAVCGGIGTD